MGKSTGCASGSRSLARNCQSTIPAVLIALARICIPVGPTAVPVGMFVSMGRNAVVEFVWISKLTETTVENVEKFVYPVIIVSLACVGMMSRVNWVFVCSVTLICFYSSNKVKHVRLIMF